ncbi:uncharacterized protein K02A2.6-like [Sabethes cyaneus]|uniref:uncharacterized protein K02A2.6-like n=1 Tax=Sabethes cyaneus TaxID=53552 RepID=UPI00237D9BF1|nr:uncharacterized protein K02A2.6-like [Sabethes cyaneus]
MLRLWQNRASGRILCKCEVAEIIKESKKYTVSSKIITVNVCGVETHRFVPVSFPGENISELFSEKIGLCQKTKINLELKEQRKPVFCPKRPVAYAMLDAVNQELDGLEQLNIISPVDYSEWAAPIVVVRKANGSILICGDYLTLAKLANCELFSQIDLSDAFLQVEIDEASRGVKIAPGAFQQLIDTILTGLKGTSGYMNDIVVDGANEEEHDRNLKAVLQRIEDFGFTI